MNRLSIVTGASGKLGEAFIETLKNQGETVYAFSRRSAKTTADELFVADLLDETQVEVILNKIDFSAYKEVLLVHTVGKFKFQGNGTEIIDANGDGIDDEVYDTNVITTKNILKFLLSTIESGVPIRVCAFASVSDKHNVPFWSSYTRAKNILRGYLQTLCETQKLSVLMVNVTTVDTGNENLLRPNADKTYWLKPQEIVDRVLPELVVLSGYKEIDVIKEKPDFDEKYYIDHEALLEKWRTEMGLNS